MRILLSIKPEYVEQIERHTKLFDFKGKNQGIAIVIKDYIKFVSPIDPYKVNSDFTPPQSYAYLDNIFPDGIEQHLPKND